MWFRNLKRELEQAEHANATLRQRIRDGNREWRVAYAALKSRCERWEKIKDYGDDLSVPEARQLGIIAQKALTKLRSRI